MNASISAAATSKSKLRAQCLVEVSDSLPIVRFVLFEYGSHKVNDLGGENLDLKIKLADGTTKFFNLFGNGEFASLNVNNSIKLVEIMKKESQLLKVYVERLSDYSKSTYNFTINPLGFTNAVNKLYKIDNTKN